MDAQSPGGKKTTVQKPPRRLTQLSPQAVRDSRESVERHIDEIKSQLTDELNDVLVEAEVRGTYCLNTAHTLKKFSTKNERLAWDRLNPKSTSGPQLDFHLAAPVGSLRALVAMAVASLFDSRGDAWLRMGLCKQCKAPVARYLGPGRGHPIKYCVGHAKPGKKRTADSRARVKLQPASARRAKKVGSGL